MDGTNRMGSSSSSSLASDLFGSKESSGSSSSGIFSSIFAPSSKAPGRESQHFESAEKKQGSGSQDSSIKPGFQDKISHSNESGNQSGTNKPSWIVRTEANVRIERRKKPDPPCVVCSGSGRVDCAYCNSTGRTNYIHLTMLPKGEWPKWCRTCGGSGLDYCTRCLGTGEYRYIMGFSFMKRDSDGTQNQQNLRRLAVIWDLGLQQISF